MFYIHINYLIIKNKNLQFYLYVWTCSIKTNKYLNNFLNDFLIKQVEYYKIIDFRTFIPGKQVGTYLQYIYLLVL